MNRGQITLPRNPIAPEATVLTVLDERGDYGKLALCQNGTGAKYAVYRMDCFIPGGNGSTAPLFFVAHAKGGSLAQNIGRSMRELHGEFHSVLTGRKLNRGEYYETLDGLQIHADEDVELLKLWYMTGHHGDHPTAEFVSAILDERARLAAEQAAKAKADARASRRKSPVAVALESIERGAALDRLVDKEVKAGRRKGDD